MLKIYKAKEGLDQSQILRWLSKTPFEMPCLIEIEHSLTAISSPKELAVFVNRVAPQNILHMNRRRVK